MSVLKNVWALIIASPRTTAGAVAAIGASVYMAISDPSQLTKVEFWTIVFVALSGLFAADAQKKS